MSGTEMSKTYDPHQTEKRLYDWWEKQGYFAPETQFEKGLASREQKPFVISMPPSNSPRRRERKTCGSFCLLNCFIDCKVLMITRYYFSYLFFV